MSVAMRHVSCVCVAVHVGKGLSTPLGFVSALTPGLPNLGPQLKGAAGLQTPSEACAALQPAALSRKAHPQGLGQAPSQRTSRSTPQLESPPRFQSPCPPPTAPSGPSAFALCPRAGLALCLLLLCPLCRQQRALSESPKTENKEALGFPWSAVGEGRECSLSSAWVLPPPPPRLLCLPPTASPLPLPQALRLRPLAPEHPAPSWDHRRGDRVETSPGGSALGLPGAWKIQLTAPSLDGRWAVPAKPSRTVH